MGAENLNDIDHEGGGSSGAEINDEVFRDQQRATQQQVTAIRKAEANARAKDDQLAKVIQRLLQSQTNATVMMLIATCIGHNIPAGLILGLLALIEPEAQAEFEKLMGESVLLLAGPSAAESRALTTAQHFDAAHIPPHVKLTIDRWAAGLLEFGFTQPTRLIATAVSPEGAIYTPLAELTAHVIREYLGGEGLTATVNETKPFADILLKNVIAMIRTRMGETKELGEG